MSQQLRILILEDREDDVELVVRELRRSGLDFLHKHAATQDKYLSLLEQESWDIILSDYNLPQFNAMDALKLLNKKTMNIPFIVVSGSIGEKLAVEIMKAGANDYIMKNNLARLGPAVEKEIKAYREQKRAEESLTEQDKIYREAITQADAVPYRRDYVGEKLIFFGEGIKKLTGYSIEELTPEIWKGLIQEQIMRGVNVGYSAEEAIQRVRSGKVSEWKADYRIQTRNGETRWLSDSSVQLFDPEGKLIGSLGILQDITERVQAGKEIVMLSHAIQSVKECISITDKDNNFLYVNDAFLKTYGYERNELIGKKTSILGLGETPEKMKEVLEATLKGGWQGELINIKRDGTKFPIFLSTSVIRDDHNEAIALIGVARDITERKRAEETLREQGRIYREAITQADAVPYQRYYNKDQYIFLGDNIKTLTGYSREELTPDTWKGLIQEAIMRGVNEGLSEAQAVQRVRSGEVSEWKADYRFRRRDGEIRWMFDSSIQLFDSEGKPIGALGILQDITERKQAEQIREIFAILAKKLSEVITPKDVANVIMSAADELFGWDACILNLYHEDEKKTEPILFIDTIDGQRKEFPSQLPRDTISPTFQRVLKEGPLLILRNESDLKKEDERVRFGNKDRKSASLMYVPIHKQTENIGFLSIQSYTPNAYNQKDLDLLRTLADQCSGALERTFAEQDKEIQLQRITALRNIDQAIAGSLDVRVVLNVILDQVVQQLPVDAGVIFLLNSKTQILQYAAGRGFRSQALQYTHLHIGEGNAGKAALEQRLIHIPNLKLQPGTFQKSPELGKEEFIAYFAVPLSAKGKVLGVLEIFHRKPLYPNSEWLDFLNTLAGQAAIAIDEAELFENLQQSNMELHLAYETTIEGWSKALDLRDKETEGHTLRVTELTLRLAQEMGVHERNLIHIRRGALLHDIGKMGIPDSILLKHDKLTEEEWVIMKKHPVYAYELIYPIAYLRPALDIPYCHHEKWDGSGYPQGLKAEMIPLTARIFAIVDVWDALRSDRPYRKAWDKEKIMEHIKSGSGTHFDPKVVEAFLKMKL